MSSASEMIALARRLDHTRIDRGLTNDELAAVEVRYGFRFPQDLRTLLSLGLPVGKNWPEWRSITALDGFEKDLHKRLEWPLEGILFDVEHNTFWDPQWGERPEALTAALNIATRAVRAAPVLIPVYAHRYLPCEPFDVGNPVLSVYQTDIIVYGRDLLSYFRAECDGRNDELSKDAREIRCWTRWMNAKWSS